MSFQFRVGESSAEGAGRIAREQIGRAVDHLVAVSSSVDRDEAIHEARKRIKKARAILRLARVPIGKGRAGKADRRLRDAARPLSEARDASALAGLLDKLAEGVAWSVPPAAFDEARRVLAARRDEHARQALDGGDALLRGVSALRGVRRRIARWDLRDDDTDPASGLRWTYKRGRAAFVAASAEPSPESFHAWRKRVKDLGYQLWALGVDPSGIASRLRRLGEELGELHDLDVLGSTLPASALEPIRARIESRREELRCVTLRSGAETFSEKPGRFARRTDTARAAAVE